MFALVLTCRPHFRPWLQYQLGKQEHPHQLVVFDDCTEPQDWGKDAVTVRPSNRMQLSLGQKRQCLLDIIKDMGQPFAWFDDDDWQAPGRLTITSAFEGAAVHVIGCRDGLFLDCKTLATRALSYPPLIFNSAVFSADCATVPFQPMHRGEDTDWLGRVCRDRVLVTTPELQHAWVSHNGNVTGKRGSMTFSGPRFTKLDAWERSFLERV